MSKKKYKILVAEDDNFLAKVVKDELEGEEFEVILAKDGGEALSMLKSEKPDLMLLDLIMPIKNGFRVLEELKLDKSKKIPIIVLSNLGQDIDIKKALSSGAVDYLIKSDFTMEAIVNKVREHLVKKR